MKFTDRASIPGVVQAMTLEEKVRFLMGTTMFRTAAIEDYQIPEVYYLDGGTGLSMMQMVLDARTFLGRKQRAQAAAAPAGGRQPSNAERMQSTAKLLNAVLYPQTAAELDDETRRRADDMTAYLNEHYMPGGEKPGCFPPGILLGSTWSPETIYRCARALGRECRYYGVDVLLGSPNVNIHRDPLCGRLFESYSEDPYLTAALAPSFVRGIQDEGVIANVKHFAANNQETERRGINEIISERALQEIYFPGFRACVQEGGCKSVMSAYNSINGTPCAHNARLLKKVLRDDWGFDGFVVSDWNAVYDQVEALRGGNDVDMPGMRSPQPILDAVAAGTLTQAQIDEAVTHVLNVLADMPKSGRTPVALDRAGSAAAAYEAAKEGMILLKNENRTLPLRPDAQVSLLGEVCRRFAACGGGSASVVSDESSSLLETLSQRLGEDHVTFGRIADAADTVIVTAASMGSEGYDRRAMELEPEDKALVCSALGQAKAAGKKTVLILNVCGPIDMRDFDALADAVVCVYFPGMEGGHAAADLLCGVFSPSGKLTTTFGTRYEDYGSSTSFPGWNGEVRYGEDLFVGYRHFDRWGIEPRYPFGFGLSYTTFQISNARLSGRTLSLAEGERLCLQVDVTNTGDMAGKEVVQVYLHADRPARPRPVKELKGFEKVFLEPGQTKTVSFVVDGSMLRVYDEKAGWIELPGSYTLLIGSSSRCLPEQVHFRAAGFDPYGLTGKSTLNDIANTRGALELLLDAIPAGLLSREAINTGTLFMSQQTLDDFWHDVVAPKLPQDRADKTYRTVCAALNALSSAE